MDKNKLVYPELSYQIVGALFDVHNKLGNELQEKVYQKAFGVKLKELKLEYQREFYLPITAGSNLFAGKYFIDFVVDKKIALEFKAKQAFSNNDIRQLLAYLKVSHLKLGILVNFRSRMLTYKRVVNPAVTLV